jgi:spore maturation protein CgeB
MSLTFVFLGLSITSSWGNGHATTYRGLTRELRRRGHEVWFLERDLEFYADNRDLADPRYCLTRLYRSLDELRILYARLVRDADFVVVGSYVPEGTQVARWAQQTARGATAFYDIDTPVTLAKLARGEHDYINPTVIPGFDVYLSFTGGPTLGNLVRRHGARRAEALYCSVDPELYEPCPGTLPHLDLGYLGTYSVDRQPTLDALLVEPARRYREGRFFVAGPQYPDSLAWPANIDRTPHLAPSEHRGFYASQRYTLNVTRRDMVEAGWSPSVRLFEAAACGTPVLSDSWPGIEDFFEPGREIRLVRTPSEVLEIVQQLPEAERLAWADRARTRVLRDHTASHRAETLEWIAQDVLTKRTRSSRTA